jgi:hypothetical protein
MKSCLIYNGKEMKLTYEQHKVLAGMTVEGKLVLHDKKGKYLKPTPSKQCPNVSQCIQGPQRQSHVLTANHSQIYPRISSLLRVRRQGKAKSFSISA